MYLITIIFCSSLLPKNRAQAVPAVIGTTSVPTPVTVNFTNVLLVAITTVSIDSNTEASVFI